MKSKEVEMKCYITQENKKRIEKFLEKNTEFLGSVEKYDQYFSTPDNAKKIAFRIRTEQKNDIKKHIITKKIQTITSQGLEVNDELEFEVSNAKAFEEFSNTQGFPKMFTKRKKIQTYSLENMCIEWAEIEPIGEFLEVEIVTDKAGVPNASEKIHNFFKNLNLLQDIEKCPYFVLLNEATQ